MKKAPFISIIIANFNGEKYLDTCLKSVLVSNYRNFELLIVDDGSTDKSREIIEQFQKKDPRISVLFNNVNQGAAASRNKAITVSKGDIFVFLDNDTEATSSWLDELIKSLDKNNVGAAQSFLLDFEKRSFVQMAGGLLIPQTGWLIPFYQRDEYSHIKKDIKEYKIVAISAALAVKRRALEKVGGFDEKEALYTEDLDFCWRIWLAGFEIILSSKSIVYHYTKSVSQRSNMRSSNFQIYFHLAKNSFRSMIKNYEISNVFKFLPMSMFINFFRGLLVLFKRGDSSALLGSIYAVFWNIIYLGDTLKMRKKIQRHRKIKDLILLKKVFTQDNLIALYNNYFRVTKLLW